MTKQADFKAEFSFLTSLGYDPLIVYTHAYHESGGFNHVIGNYNFWGIKCPKSWTGIKVPVITHEYVNGQKIQVTANFCDWPDLSNAIRWYDSLIQRLYPQAYQARTDYKIYFPALINYKYKYATDPAYVPILIKLYEELSNENRLP